MNAAMNLLYLCRSSIVVEVEVEGLYWSWSCRGHGGDGGGVAAMTL